MIKCIWQGRRREKELMNDDAKEKVSIGPKNLKSLLAEPRNIIMLIFQLIILLHRNEDIKQ